MLRTPHRARCLAVGIALCGMWCGCNSLAQEAAAPAPEADDWKDLPQATGEDMSLEMPMLLGSAKMPPLEDAVWHLSPNKIAGKSKTKYKLTVVPLRLTPKKVFKAGSPPVGPLSGQFVAWYVPRPGKSLLGNEKSEVPVGAPRFTAGIAVTDDGRVHWSVDRFPATMNLAGKGSLTDAKTFYAMSMNRKLLTALAPPPFKLAGPYKRAARAKKDSIEAYLAKEEKAREAYDKKKEADRKAYEARVAQYRAVMDTVGSLPFKFSEPAPELVYAVYYTREKDMDRIYGGYGEAGNWKPSSDEWQALTSLVKQDGKTPSGKDRAGLEAKLKLLVPMVNSKHPAALQAVAEALAGSGLLNNLTEDSVPFEVGSKLIASQDAWARQRVMKSLLAANISTGKAALLVHAVDAADLAGNQATGDKLRISALRVQLHAKATDTDSKRIQAVVDVLVDANGPAPAQALEELHQVMEVEGVHARRGEPLPAMPIERAKAAAQMFKACDIKDPKRRKETLVAVLEASDKSPLAAMLVDEWLLGATKGLTSETLAAMADWAGRKTDARVPLFAEDHRLVALLLADDAQVRAAAWRALPACQVRQTFAVPVMPKSKGVPQAPPVANANAVFPKLVAGALALKPTPSQLAPFFGVCAAQPATRPAALHGLIEVLVEGDAAAAKQAATLFAGADLAPDFTKTLLNLPAEARFKAVSHCYAGGGVPDPAGLIVVPQLSDDLARWFGARFVKGQIPSADQWVAQVPEKAPLLDWVLAQNPDLARGAVSALAYREGADDAMAAATVTRMLAKPYKLEGQMQREWLGCQTDIFMAVLEKSQGPYAVRVAAYARGDKAWREEVAGQVTLKLEKQTVSLGIPGVSMTVLPIKKLLNLADFALLDRVNVKTRQNLQLSQVSGAVEFKWQAPCWVAQWRPDADHVAQVRLTPVDWNEEVPVPVLPAAPRKK